VILNRGTVSTQEEEMHQVIRKVFTQPEGVHMLYCCASDVIRCALGFEGVDAFVANDTEKSVWAAIFPCEGFLYAACGRYSAPRPMWNDLEKEFGDEPFALPEGAVMDWMESAFVVPIGDESGAVVTLCSGLGLEEAAIAIVSRMRMRRLEREAKRVPPPEPEPPPLLDGCDPKPPPSASAPTVRIGVDLDAIS
jgi:hypothetical protein